MLWLIRFADRTHPLALPGAWVVLCLIVYATLFAVFPGNGCCWRNPVQLWGTALTYTFISGYLLAAIVYRHRGHRDAVKALIPMATSTDAVDEALADVSTRVLVLAGVAGAIFGLSQYAVVLSTPSLLHPVPDIPLIVGNVLLWIVVGGLTVSRMQDVLAMRRLGRNLNVDLYNLKALRPIGRSAVVDVLVVMGALAFMPLQSLDAEFNWGNYEAGLFFGLIVSVLIFYLPLSGVHAQIREAKAARLQALQALIDGQDRSDVVALEALVAHRDRVAHLSSWPVDMSILSRVGFYLIIPPLAWVGAALVETLVQGYIE